jgi:hypothetical protein
VRIFKRYAIPCHFCAWICCLTYSIKIVSTDDYMPMAINSLEEYEKVVNVSWFSQEKGPQELT